MNIKLDKYEQEIEKNIDQFQSVNIKKKSQIDTIIKKANKKKSISLRLKASDLE